MMHNLGTQADLAVVDSSSAATVTSLLKGLLQQLGGAAAPTIKRAVVSAASSGDNTLVAAVTAKKIKVLAIVLHAVTAVTVRLESGAGGTALTGVISLGATSGFVLPMTRPGFHWVETAAGALLNLELGGAVQVSGVVVYYEEA